MNDPYVRAEDRAERGPLWAAIVAALAVTVLLGGLLAVVTDDGGETDAIALLSAAPAAAVEAKTARIELRTEVGGSGMDMTMSGDGVVDFVTGASSMAMSMFGMDFELRTLDGTMYMRLPDVGRPPTMTQDWIGIPLPKAAGATPMATPNAASMLDSLRGMGNEVEELGDEEINGQQATGYRVTIDLARALEELPEDQQDWAQDSLEQMRAMGMTEWPMEVWLAGDLPVRVAMDVDDIGGAGVDMHMVIDYLDFGTDISVEAPAADQVLLLDDPTQLQQLFAPQPAA